MRPLAVITIVAATDWLTKLLLVTPPELDHYRGRSYALLAFAIALIALVLGHRLGSYLPASLLAAGCITNGLDLLDGVGSNPFLVLVGPSNTDVLGFNVGDVAIVTAALVVGYRAVRDLARRAFTQETAR